MDPEQLESPYFTVGSHAYQTKPYKSLNQELYSLCLDGSPTINSGQEDLASFMRGVEEDKHPEIVDPPAFQPSLEIDSEESERQQIDCLEIVTGILAEYEYIFDEIKQKIRERILEGQSLNNFRRTDFSTREMMDGIAMTFLQTFRSADFSLSNNLALALAQQFEGKETSEVSYLENENRQDVYSDYVETSTRLSELIVSENHASPLSKVVKPINLGGIAGGQKFVCKSILFKVSKDIKLSSGDFLYSGAKSPKDDFAMKAAAQELLGSSHYYFALENMNLPIFPAMQCLVDYKGHRIVALPLLPIDHGTLVYGSEDCGSTVKVHEEVDLILKEVAKTLYLATHLVCGVSIHTAGDVEVHKAYNGRLYLIDMARCFPPEHVLYSSKKLEEKIVGSSIFFRMLRPEFLQIWKKHTVDNKELSPDACSGWGRDQPELNATLYEATQFLLDNQIPILVAQIVDRIKRDDSLIDLAMIFHKHGVNMRFLGFVVSLIPFDYLKVLPSEQQVRFLKLFSSEILYRCLKSKLRCLLRSCKVSNSSGAKRVTASWISSTIRTLTENIDGLKSIESIVVESFGKNALSFLQSKMCFDQWRYELGTVFLRVFQRCGISLTSETKRIWETATSSKLEWYSSKLIFFEIDEHEFLSFDTKINGMPIIDQHLCRQILSSSERAKKKRNSEHSFCLNKIAYQVALRCLRRFPLRSEYEEVSSKLKLSILVNENSFEYRSMNPSTRSAILLDLFKTYTLQELFELVDDSRIFSRFPDLVIALWLKQMTAFYFHGSQAFTSDDVFHIVENALSYENVFSLVKSGIVSQAYETLMLIQIFLLYFHDHPSTLIFSILSGWDFDTLLFTAQLRRTPFVSLLKAIQLNSNQKKFIELPILERTKIMGYFEEEQGLFQQFIFVHDLTGIKDSRVLRRIAVFPKDHERVLKKAEVVLKLPCSWLLATILRFKKEYEDSGISVDDLSWKKEISVNEIESKSDRMVNVRVMVNGELLDSYSQNMNALEIELYMKKTPDSTLEKVKSMMKQGFFGNAMTSWNFDVPLKAQYIFTVCGCILETSKSEGLRELLMSQLTSVFEEKEQRSMGPPRVHL
jgi:hypothetical protein